MKPRSLRAHAAAGPSAGTRSVLYLRRSRDDREGSIPLQDDVCRGFATRKGYQVAETVVDMESAWGDGAAGREGYQRVIAMARAGEIDHVVVWQFSRFGRDMVEAVSRYRELKRLGVTLHSTSETLESEFTVGLFALLAQDESDRISARIRPRKRQLAAGGRHQAAKMPFGLRRVYLDSEGREAARPSDGVMQFVPGPHFEIVRRAFDLCAAGMGVQPLAEQIVREFGASPRWGASTLRYALHNPAYIGTLRGQLPDGYGEVPGAWPALIDRETWDRTQATLARRTQHHARHQHDARFALYGLVFCGCGHQTHIASAQRSRKEPDLLYYYRCNGKANHSGCGACGVRALAVEAWALEQIRGRQLPAAYAPRVLAHARAINAERRAQQAGGAEELMRERERLAARRTHIEDLAIDGTLAPERARARLRELEAELAALDARLRAVPGVDLIDGDRIAAALCSDGWLTWQHTDRAGFRAMLTLLVERVVLDSPAEWRIEWTWLARVFVDEPLDAAGN